MRSRAPLVWVALITAVGAAVFALKLDPGLWTAVGDHHLRAGRLVPAERAYQRALDIDLDHGPALYGLGWAYLTAGLPDPAEERFKRAVNVAPGFFGGHRGMGEIHRRKGEILAAEQSLRTAHDLAPDDPALLADLGGLYMDAGFPDQGIELFRRAAEADSDRAEYRLAMSEALLSEGRVEEARTALEATRELRSSNRRFEAATDELLLRAALVEIEQLIEADGLDYTTCGHAKRRMEEAQAHLDAALARDLEHALALSDRQSLEAMRSRVERACGPSYP